jgi:hypothetical protein
VVGPSVSLQLVGRNSSFRLWVERPADDVSWVVAHRDSIIHTIERGPSSQLSNHSEGVWAYDSASGRGEFQLGEESGQYQDEGAKSALG